MESREERLARLRRASQESANAADSLLAGELAALQQATVADLESLRPKVQDSQAFEQLIAAVQASTRQNESIAQFRQRVGQLGPAVVKAAQLAATLLKA